MFSKQEKDPRKQVQLLIMDDMVPKDHILRQIDETIDFSFIYDLVEDRYSPDKGRPSLDPVTLIKLPMIQYICGIRSMRQTIKECEVNVAYRWFLGLDFNDPIPHFSTFGKNYTRRFKGTDIFEQIFENILDQCIEAGFVDGRTLFIDGTHVKARANPRKAEKRKVQKAVRRYETALQKEIAQDREAHGKKGLPERKQHAEGDDESSEGHEQKTSRTDPESGWFHKGEHRSVFAYVTETACDRNGWVVGYTVHPGNMHDSVCFWELYDKLKKNNPSIETIVADAGYKTPAIAKALIDDGITPNFPYTRPKTKKGYLSKSEFVYDEYYDCYLCPENKVLNYSTTNREGYREYKSQAEICVNCPSLNQCTQSKNHVKLITRHVWSNYLEQCEDIRQTGGRKEEYNRRKETIERIFGTAKEQHSMRYTQYQGKERAAMQIGLTFACMNMKKLAKMLTKKRQKTTSNPYADNEVLFFCSIIRKTLEFKKIILKFKRFVYALCRLL